MRTQPNNKITTITQKLTKLLKTTWQSEYWAFHWIPTTTSKSTTIPHNNYTTYQHRYTKRTIKIPQ